MKFLFSFFLIFQSLCLVAQPKRIVELSGKVMNIYGEPIAYANVLVKNKFRGTAAGFGGEFSLLVQTGYLTIKHFDIKYNTYTLNYPNREVAESFSYHLLTSFNKETHENNSSLLNDLTMNIVNNEIDEFIETLNTIFANITYPNIDKKEKYYHSIFYLTLKLLGYNIQSEVMTIKGRIDVVLHTDTHIYVIELKVSDAQTAMNQIKTKKYHQRYMNEPKSIVLLGIGFDMNKKEIGNYLVEVIK